MWLKTLLAKAVNTFICKKNPLILQCIISIHVLLRKEKYYGIKVVFLKPESLVNKGILLKQSSASETLWKGQQRSQTSYFA